MTFEASKLDWGLRQREPHTQVLEFHRELLAMRRRHPALHNGRKDLTKVTFDEGARRLAMERTDPGGDRVSLAVDFARRTLSFSPSH